MTCTIEEYKAAKDGVNDEEIFYQNAHITIFTHNNQTYFKDASLLRYWVFIDWRGAQKEAEKLILKTIVNGT